MYCPKCGTQNPENATFCRACGLDLGTIARAMEKHLPLAILEKIDDKVFNPKKTRLYKLVFAVLLSIALIAFAVHLWNTGYSSDAPFYLIVAAFSLLGTVWEFMLYVRSRSKTKMVLTTNDYIELNRAFDDNQFKQLSHARDTAKIAAQPPSVTEHSTELLTKKR